MGSESMERGSTSSVAMREDPCPSGRLKLRGDSVGAPLAARCFARTGIRMGSVGASEAGTDYLRGLQSGEKAKPCEPSRARMHDQPWTRVRVQGAGLSPLAHLLRGGVHEAASEADAARSERLHHLPPQRALAATGAHLAKEQRCVAVGGCELQQPRQPACARRLLAGPSRGTPEG